MNFIQTLARLEIKSFLKVVLGGALLGLSIPYHGFWPLAFVGLMPLFEEVRAVGRTKTQAFFLGFVLGLVYFAFARRWYLSLHPMDWLGVDSALTSLIIIAITFVLLVVLCAVFFGLFALFYRNLLNTKLVKESSGPWPLALMGAGGWVIFEYLRAWGYGLFGWAPGALIGPHWSFSNLGYALHNVTSLRALASIGGVYLLSFSVVFFSIVSWWIYKNRKAPNVKRQFCISVILILCWVLAGFTLHYRGLYIQDTSFGMASAIAVATDFSADYSQNVSSPEIIATHNQRQLATLDQALQLKPDIIVFPEGSELSGALIDKFVTTESVSAYFAKATSDHPTVLLENSFDKVGRHSRLYFLDSVDGLLGIYDKRLIVPGGEYTTMFVRVTLSALGASGLIREAKILRELKSGDYPNVVVATRYGNIGGLICSENITTELPRLATKAGAEILAISSSNALLRSDPVILAENEAMSQIRAIENGRYVVMAANVGYSYIVNSVGDVIAVSYPDEPQKVAQVKMLQHETFYVSFGNWLVTLSFIVILLVFVADRRRV